VAKPRSNLGVLRKTMRELRTDFSAATEPDERSSLGRTIAMLSAEVRRAELHEQALRPEAKTPEEHEARIRFHFEALTKPRQVEVAKALGMIAGDGTLLGR
jgi:hypothetical protein